MTLLKRLINAAFRPLAPVQSSEGRECGWARGELRKIASVEKYIFTLRCNYLMLFEVELRNGTARRRKFSSDLRGVRAGVSSRGLRRKCLNSM